MRCQLLLGVAAMIAVGSGPAHAATIVRTFNFTGTNIQNIAGTTPSPLSSVHLSFTVTFDPAVQALNQTTGLTLNSTNLALGSTLAFSYIPTNNQRLAVGGLANGVFGISAANDDFTLDLSRVTGPNPTVSVFQFTTAATPGNAFRAFSTNLTSSVPEPSTWLMMILGFGVVGAAMRHRRRMQINLNPYPSG